MQILAELETSLRKIQQLSNTNTNKLSFSRFRRPASTGAVYSSTSANKVHAPPSKTAIDETFSSSSSVVNVLETRIVPEPASIPSRSLKYIRLSDLDDVTGSVSFSNLDKCILDFRSASEDDNLSKNGIPALYLENISHCLVIAADITGSVLIHDASNCIFILKCHQVSKLT